MAGALEQRTQITSMHSLGVACGIAAGAWLGSAEAPIKLVASGYSPIVISLCMVMGVFVGRWTLPTLAKGTSFVWQDVFAKPHLIIWAILAGALWAVANTLTVFAIRNVGLSIAFPLWNTNSLVGLLWGFLLFGELRGAGIKNWSKVLGGAVAIVVATIILALASTHESVAGATRPAAGVLAALGASVLWGTMYVPYRKAYVSGMNPLSFITVFTFGELGTMAFLGVTTGGGVSPLVAQLTSLKPAMFYLFLGGFCWVVGDMFQHFATKYIGISRGIPLSNTNQLWGLAWGALVFGELANVGGPARLAIVLGSVLMILGALSISSATARESEQLSTETAIRRECNRYQLSYAEIAGSQHGEAALQEPTRKAGGRSWIDLLIVAAAVGVFVWLGREAAAPPPALLSEWSLFIVCGLLVLLGGSGWLLWKRTRFT